MIRPNAGRIARREKLMALALANLIVTGFMHADPSGFMRQLPPFGGTFTLPEDVRVAYEALSSPDPLERIGDDRHIGRVSGAIAHGVFGGSAKTETVVSTLANLFLDLTERDVMLPNVDGVTQTVNWMRQTANEYPINDVSKHHIYLIRNVCEQHYLFKKQQNEDTLCTQ